MISRAVISTVALLAVSATVHSANLVNNASFECSLANWVGEGSASFVPGVAKDGSCSGGLGFAFPGTHAGALSQVIATTIGNKYLLSFWAAAAPNGQSFNVSASFGPASMPLELAAFPTAFVFNEYSAEVTAASTSSTLLFNATSISGRFFVDSVSIADLGPAAPVPELNTTALLGMGIGALALVRRVRVKQFAS